MRRKRLLIIAIIVLCLLVLEVGIVSYWMLRQEQRRLNLSMGRNDNIVRIGILPTISKNQSEKIWLPYLDAVEKFSHELKIKPYFANSFEEIAIGFKHDVLDLAFINTALGQKLCKDDNATFFASLVPKDQEDYYSVLLAKSGDIRFLKDTRDKRITFTNKNSVAGYLIPKRYLSKKLDNQLDSWFSEIRFSGNDNQAIRDLIQDKTDIVAVNYRALKYFLNHTAGLKDEFSVIWMFRNIPGSVLCRNKQLKEDIVENLKKVLFHEKHMDIKDFLLFLPPDSQDYQLKLNAYNKFMND